MVHGNKLNWIHLQLVQKANIGKKSRTEITTETNTLKKSRIIQFKIFDHSVKTKWCPPSPNEQCVYMKHNQNKTKRNFSI